MIFRKMKRIVSIIVVALCSSAAFAWGPIGHGTVAALAEYNVKPSTLKQVEHYLGRSMSFYAVWADEFRSDPRYEHTSNHAMGMDENHKYVPSTGKDDLLQTIDKAIAIIRDRDNQTDSTVAVQLKLLIHMVGDIHCPSHTKDSHKMWSYKVYAYKGSDRQLSYHGIWDEEILERRRESLSPRELGADFNRLSKKEIKEVQKGTPVDWAEQTARETACISDMAHEGDVLFKEFYNPAWEIVQRQLTLGGYRLAKLLDELF